MLAEILVFIFVFLLALQYFTQRRPHTFPPGPIGIPILGYLPFLKLPLHKGLWELSQKYGEIFSVNFAGYQLVVLTNPKHIKETFNKDVFTGRPNIPFLRERSWGEKRGIIFGDGPDWNAQRRFTMKNLRDFGWNKGTMESLIVDEVVDLVSEFKKELNQPVDLSRRFNAAVLNALWHIIAGERFSHDDPKLGKLIKALSEDMMVHPVSGPIFFMPWLTKLFPNASGYNSLMECIKGTFDFLQVSIDAHKESFNSDNMRDFIDMFLQEINDTKDETSGFYKERGEKSMLVVLSDLFVAGAETTSTTLKWAILYLITYPNVQKRLQEEIDEIVGSGKFPSLSDRPRMPYLEAFIAETLRKSSITPLGVFHSTTESVELLGYTLPKDTMIVGNFWQCHHDDVFWKNPDEFLPERFIGDDGHLKKESANALISFSTGKRVCLGESLARDELFLFISGLLQQLVLEPEKDVPPATLEPKEETVLTTFPYKVVMKARENVSSTHLVA